MSDKLQDTLSHLICRIFGVAAPESRESVTLLLHILATHPENALFHKWQNLRFNATGCDPCVWQKTHDLIAKKLLNDKKYQAKNSAALLFAVETYFAIIVQAFLRYIGQAEPEVAAIYQWPFDIYDSKARAKYNLLAARINDKIERLATSGTFQQPHSSGDLFGTLYENLIPAAARKQLGEFYTPLWLADHLLGVAGFDEAVSSGNNIRVLDPACGSGTFLLAAERRMLKVDMPTERIAQSIAGFDLNPLAVLMSTANLAMVLATHESNGNKPLTKMPSLQIACHDSIRNTSPFDGTNLPESFGQFDFVVGNPPWLVWDKLPPEYRKQTKTLWQHYGLFNLSGKDARYGGAKKELALLMAATSADLFLKTGGRLAMVLPQTVFQTHKTGSGFRQFGSNDPTRALKVLRVDDFSAVRVFRDTTTKTATLVLEKGKPTIYPTPYFCWQSQHCCRACHAEPVDLKQPGSAWRIMEQYGQLHPADVPQKSDYQAILGANTGGANGIYWVTIVSVESHGIVTIRNLAECGKHQLPVIEAEIESELLYPLLRWRDVHRFSAVPSTWVIIVQDPATRSGLPLEVMQKKYPKTLAYLWKFETQLRNRAVYRKYLPNAPFYSMYNISLETFAPIKVVWRRMDTRIRAAVVPPFDASCDLRFAQGYPVIPQETCSMIAVSGLDEAYYLAELLNSEAVHQRVAACSVQGSKGFGSPGMLEHLSIRRFDANNETHIALVPCPG